MPSFPLIAIPVLTQFGAMGSGCWGANGRFVAFNALRSDSDGCGNAEVEAPNPTGAAALTGAGASSSPESNKLNDPTSARVPG